MIIQEDKTGNLNHSKYTPCCIFSVVLHLFNVLIITTRLEKTALLKLLDLYLFSFIYEIKTEEFTHQLTNQLIWISLNQGADST